ncbi:MAG: hypothetical protein J5813_00170 [Candidatus Methanomethylophilaceae archaeon]|nr:hypothetical protein [Candidatus Methanomethylophilaceae archaeon]
MAKLEAELEPYADRIAELKSEIVNRDELIEHFKLNMDDVATLEEGLKQMFDRVGMLQNAIVSARNSGDKKEAFELELELIEIRELRNETLARVKELKNGAQ